MKLKNLLASLLRGGFCAVWVMALIVSFYEFLYAVTSDIGSPEQSQFLVRAIVSISAGIIAAIAHAYLLSEAKNSKGAHIE